MAKSWPKVIRDPVHNIIPFEDSRGDRLVLDLINAREFQRLRRIKQLGMADMVFPSANHSRFSHCIGVMHIARMMLDRVDKLTGSPIGEDQRIAVLVAALLHDIGHGPFSHAFEKVTGQRHEKRTLEIITDGKIEIVKCLREYDKDLPLRLEIFFDEDIDADKHEAAEIPEFLTQIVSSQLDADRFDYLLRDSDATGTDYGQYDLSWLLLQLRLDPGHKRFYLSKKALSAAEAYIFARYHMYRSVYFHKAIRAAEVMLRLLFQRFRQLLNSARSASEQHAIAPGTPDTVIQAFTGQISLDEYLALDDSTVTEFFKACSSAKDDILREIGYGLVNRRLYKAIDATGADGASIGEFASRAKEEVKSLDLDPDYVFVNETAADTPYKPYDPDASKPASQIYIETPDGQNVEISSQSDALMQLRKKYTLLRYYFPESIREKIEKIAKDTLFKEEK